jgi:iron complex transport system substrate-binding protein
VVSLDPTTLDEVIDSVTTVATAAAVPGRGQTVAEALRRRLDDVRRLTGPVDRRPVIELEWSDPPYLGGHWVPEMVERAGGVALLSVAGAPSPRVTWADIDGAGAEVLVFSPCGYGLTQAVAEAHTFLERPETAAVRAVWALDGSAYFSRPGPRVVDGVELLAWVLHPQLVPAPPPGRATRLR